MPKQREPGVYREVHRAADYYEALLRVRFVKQMKAARGKVDQRRLADAIAAKDPGKALAIVMKSTNLPSLMRPVEKIVRDAFMKGGKVGAGVVRNLG